MHTPVRILLVLSSLLLINSLPFTSENENSVGQNIATRDFFTCWLWYIHEGNPKDLLKEVEKPPCSIDVPFKEKLDGGWTVDPGCDASKQPDTCDLHKGAHGCYRHAKKPTGPGAQACYDEKGKWISDPWKGAGTVDAETPLGDFEQQFKHFLVDVVPYYDCCELSPLSYKHSCNLYYKARPTGTCKN